MAKFKLIIEYEGTNFIGWQRQSNGSSIQQSLEKAIQNLSNEKVTVLFISADQTFKIETSEKMEIVRALVPNPN